MKKRALVTGGTGFVGANLVRRLLREGWNVHLLVRPGHRPWRLEAVRNDLSWSEAELRDKDGVSRAIEKIRPARVFHLAAYGAYSWEEDPARIIATNVLGVTHLVQACVQAGVEALVNAGSSSEYGLRDHPPSEGETLEPNSYYAVGKASASLFCRFASLQHKLPITTLRLYSVFGPWEDPHRLMPTLVLAGRKGLLPPFVDPEIARDFVYVDDAVDAFLLAAEHRALGEIFNVGSGRQTTIREVAAAARKVFGIEAEPEWSSMPNRRWDTGTWIADNTKIRNTLGWEPRVTMEQGLRRMAEWFAANPETVGTYERLRQRPDRIR